MLLIVLQILKLFEKLKKNIVLSQEILKLIINYHLRHVCMKNNMFYLMVKKLKLAERDF